MLAVTVIGAESTGKTTLAAWLARRLGTACSPEGARVHFERRRQADPHAALGPADVAPIARAQQAGEESAVRLAHALGAHIVVRDTDLVSTVVYARHYYGAVDAWITEAARTRRAALYLLCDVDVPWMPDPARDPAMATARARRAMHARFVRTLVEFGCRVAEVGGAWAEREASAWQAVERLLADGPGT